MTSERTALYRIYDSDGLLLYIGISKDFGSRWKQEAKEFPWWAEMQRMTVDWISSRAQAEMAEEAAIRAEKPKYNKRHVSPGPRAAEREEVLALLAGRIKPLTLTYKQAAALLDVSMSKLFQMLRAGEIHSLKLGPQMRRVSARECSAYVDRIEAEQIGEAS